MRLEIYLFLRYTYLAAHFIYSPFKRSLVMKHYKLQLALILCIPFLLASFYIFAWRGDGGSHSRGDWNNGGSNNNTQRSQSWNNNNSNSSRSNNSGAMQSQSWNPNGSGSGTVHSQSWNGSGRRHNNYANYQRRLSYMYTGGPIYNPYYDFPGYFGGFPYPYYGYYYGINYDFLPSNYVIVTSPEDITIPSLEPTPVYKETDTSAEISTAPENNGNTITINIPNSNGGFTPVVLTKFNDGYKGPQGEYYEGHPTVEELKALYGN
jgi:hypothetical protein